ncbi:MAG: M23 family metallopeptidase [Alphaproteobacteria bacterium]|nr:M23 family metallopeptidase [Alphaproteobacteria bacterium]
MASLPKNITDLMMSEAYNNSMHPDHPETREEVDGYFEKEFDEDASSQIVWIWYAEMDEKTCATCAGFHTEVYKNRDDIPPHPHHPHCRCWIEEIPANKKEKEKEPKIRKPDRQGRGNFGAPRSGGREHAGIDIASEPGEPVYALSGGTYTRQNKPYADDPRYTGLDIKDDDGNTNKYMYVTPIIPVGTEVKEGDLIGRTQPISDKYECMGNHYHFEVRDTENNAIDPDEYLPSHTFK